MDKSSHGRKDRLIKERRHDVYRNRAKWSDGTCCRECGAVFSGGRWCWGKSAAEGKQVICPACRRILENVPAGEVDLAGDFFEMHHDEIMNLVHNVEATEKEHHPMERIMGIDDTHERATVTTTGLHLARGIGAAIAKAYKGDMSLEYLDSEAYIKVLWQR